MYVVLSGLVTYFRSAFIFSHFLGCWQSWECWLNLQVGVEKREFAAQFASITDASSVLTLLPKKVSWLDLDLIVTGSSWSADFEHPSQPHAYITLWHQYPGMGRCLHQVEHLREKHSCSGFGQHTGTHDPFACVSLQH